MPEINSYFVKPEELESLPIQQESSGLELIGTNKFYIKFDTNKSEAVDEIIT